MRHKLPILLLALLSTASAACEPDSYDNQVYDDKSDSTDSIALTPALEAELIELLHVKLQSVKLPRPKRDSCAPSDQPRHEFSLTPRDDGGFEVTGYADTQSQWPYSAVQGFVAANASGGDLRKAMMFSYQNSHYLVAKLTSGGTLEEGSLRDLSRSWPSSIEPGEVVIPLFDFFLENPADGLCTRNGDRRIGGPGAPSVCQLCDASPQSAWQSQLPFRLSDLDSSSPTPESCGDLWYASHGEIRDSFLATYGCHPDNDLSP